jgi:HSP90 family molecular chaperone
MMEKVRKVTKKERFEMIKEIVLNAGLENEAEMVEFLDNEINLLNKKRASGAKTATQKENEVLVEKLYAVLAEIGRPVTVSELQKESEDFGAMSNQKVSALMKKLKDAGRVNKVDDKKKAYFSIAE